MLNICEYVYVYIYIRPYTQVRAISFRSDVMGFSGDNDTEMPIIAHCVSLRKATTIRRRFDDVSFSLISVTRYLFLDRYGRRGSNNSVYKVFTDVATGGGGGGGEREEGGSRSERGTERASASRPSGSRQRELEAWKPYNWDG